MLVHPPALHRDPGGYQVPDSLAAMTVLDRHHQLLTDRAETGVSLNIEGLDAMLERADGKNKPLS